jgi:hypothetical protein
VVTLTSLSLSLSLDLSFVCWVGFFFVVDSVFVQFQSVEEKKIQQLETQLIKFSCCAFVVAFNAFLVTIFSIKFETPSFHPQFFMWLFASNAMEGEIFIHVAS